MGGAVPVNVVSADTTRAVGGGEGGGSCRGAAGLLVSGLLLGGPRPPLINLSLPESAGAFFAEFPCGLGLCRCVVRHHGRTSVTGFGAGRCGFCFGGLAGLHLIVGLPLHAALVDLALPEFRPAFLTYFAGMVELGPGWLIGHGFTPLLR